MTTTNNNANTGSNNDYFDCKTMGFGYLQRARLVEPKKAKPFYAVTCAVLQGKAGETSTTYFDCNIVGKEAEELVKANMEAINNGDTKVSARCIVGDIYVDEFTYSNAHATKAGQKGFSLKGRLLKLTAMKVDGKEVKPVIQNAEFGSEYWPTSRAVKLENDDADKQVKADILSKLGYEFNQPTGTFGAKSKEALALLEQRRAGFTQSVLEANSPQQKVANG